MVEFVAKVVNPIIIVAFVVIYWVVGLILYHNPSYWTTNIYVEMNYQNKRRYGLQWIYHFAKTQMNAQFCVLDDLR